MVEMNKFFQILPKKLAVTLIMGTLVACGGGADVPNYDESAMPSERRIEGELAFTSPSLMKMAESFRIAGDYTNAIRLYQRAANESPNHVTSRLALGQIYQRLGAMDGAQTFYQQVIDLDPDNSEAQLGLGQMLVQSDNPLEAVVYLEKAAIKSPDNYRIYNSIGLAYDLEGFHDQAQLAYGRGLGRNPDHISLLNNLALSLAFQDEFAPSIQLLSKAVNLDYSQTTAQQNLIMVYALSGEEQAARTMGRSFMTPDEIETNIVRYKWLKGLSSKRRAKAIFLNISSFPDEEEIESETANTPSFVSIDPKRQMLNDILNTENNKLPIEEDVPETVIEETSMAVTEVFDPEEMMPKNVTSPAFEHYQLQLGSYLSENDISIDWKRLQKNAPEMLNGQMPQTVKVITADNKERFRIYIGNYDNFSAAQEFCQALQNNQVPCLVIKKSN